MCFTVFCTELMPSTPRNASVHIFRVPCGQGFSGPSPQQPKAGINTPRAVHAKRPSLTPPQAKSTPTAKPRAPSAGQFPGILSGEHFSKLGWPDHVDADRLGIH